MLNVIENKRQELEGKYNEVVDRFDKYMKHTPNYEYIVEEARDLYAIQLQLDLLDEIEEELEDMEDKE